MEQWDQDFVNEAVEGYFRFDPDGGGEFQFGYVHGGMTCEFSERNGKPTVEWTWEGNDEMEDPGAAVSASKKAGALRQVRL
ncbi:MAG: hypothetical protein ACM359_02015 [Bacillota bacterium]